MTSVLQIGLFLASGILFFALLHRAFFTTAPSTGVLRFTSLDVAVAFSLSALFAYLALHLFIATEPTFSEKDILNSLISQLVFLGIVLGYIVYRHFPLADFFGLHQGKWWKNLALGLGLALGVFPFIGLLASQMNPDPAEAQEAVKFFQKSESTSARLLLAFMAVIVAPIVEEVVFRGLLYRIFQSYFGKMAAMFFPSVLFASIHGNVPTLLPLTLLAFALTAALERTGSLLACIAMHASFNGISLLLILSSSAP